MAWLQGGRRRCDHHFPLDEDNSDSQQQDPHAFHPSLRDDNSPPTHSFTPPATISAFGYGSTSSTVILDDHLHHIFDFLSGS